MAGTRCAWLLVCVEGAVGRSQIRLVQLSLPPGPLCSDLLRSGSWPLSLPARGGGDLGTVLMR
eukprot:6195498-Pleurochrysis_carterae.AAC.1